MQVTEVRIKLTGETDDRLLAFCSITLDDCFVVRDLKIIDGGSGPFVAMPSRKLTAHCPSCRGKNHLRSNYCSHCGEDLRREYTFHAKDSSRLYADIAHPINAACRELIQNRVIEEYEKELGLSRLPGYRSRYDDDYELLEESAESGGRRFRKDRGEPDRPPRAHRKSGKKAASGKGESVPVSRTGQADGNLTDGSAGIGQPPSSDSDPGPAQSDQVAESDDSDDQFGAGIF